MSAVSVGRLDDAKLERLRRAPLTYEPVKCSKPGSAVEVPTGYRHVSRAAVLGSGREFFDRAVPDLLSWQMHRRAGLTVRAAPGPLQVGTVAILSLGIGPLAVHAPVRVVHVIAEPNRHGFTYGTLAGHPESGQETFVIDIEHDDTVTFTITALSRPASRLARASGPIGTFVQSWMTTRYLRALRP